MILAHMFCFEMHSMYLHLLMKLLMAVFIVAVIYQDRIQKKAMEYSTSELSGNQVDSYDHTSVRHSMLNVSNHYRCILDENSSNSGTHKSRARRRIDALEAQYEARLRKKLDQDTIISDESSSKRRSDI